MQISKHTACGYTIFTKFAYDVAEDGLDFYRDKDCA